MDTTTRPTDQTPLYVADPAFLEPNDGPLVCDFQPHNGRDPSAEQIRKRCVAILKHVPRQREIVLGDRFSPLE